MVHPNFHEHIKQTYLNTIFIKTNTTTHHTTTTTTTTTTTPRPTHLSARAEKISDFHRNCHSGFWISRKRQRSVDPGKQWSYCLCFRFLASGTHKLQRLPQTHKYSSLVHATTAVAVAAAGGHTNTCTRDSDRDRSSDSSSSSSSSSSGSSSSDSDGDSFSLQQRHSFALEGLVVTPQRLATQPKRRCQLLYESITTSSTTTQKIYNDHQRPYQEQKYNIKRPPCECTILHREFGHTQKYVEQKCPRRNFVLV